mmetsp:Transcript_18273/g.38930  ORF Transcript_18273/g.38930 Transcript_18273/m.38930 type:complete len:108 (-) Transcript_18273:26-349(-)
MRSERVEAPAYFGESCLWVPLGTWGRAPPPLYTYNARSLSRTEFVSVPRQALQQVITQFSPWLAERFEVFRKAVVENHRDVMDNWEERTGSFEWPLQQDLQHDDASL